MIDDTISNISFLANKSLIKRSTCYVSTCAECIIISDDKLSRCVNNFSSKRSS